MSGSDKATYFDALKEKHGVEEAVKGGDDSVRETPQAPRRAARQTKIEQQARSAARVRRQLRIAIVLLASITSVVFLIQIFSRVPAAQSQHQTATLPPPSTPPETSEPELQSAVGIQAEILEIDEQDLDLLPERQVPATPLETRDAAPPETRDAAPPESRDAAPVDSPPPETVEIETAADLTADSPTRVEPPIEPEVPEIQPTTLPPPADTEPEPEAAGVEPSPPATTAVIGNQPDTSLEASDEASTPAPFIPATRISGNQPHYPPSALVAGIGGIVTVEVEIDETGAVRSTRVVDGQHPDLDRAAQEAIETWQFQPATRNGEPQPDTYRARIRFAPPESYQAAVRIRTPLPEYPQSAFVAGTEGIVTLRATIDDQGDVINIEVLEGLPYGLSEAAIEAVREWKFRPALSDGVPTISQQTLRIRFGR